MSKSEFEPYKIFEFGRIDLTQEDIALIPAHHLQFLGQSCLAANDIAVFLKLLIGHFKAEDSSRVVGELSVLTTIIIQRNLQSKIFEFIKIVNDYYVLCKRKGDQVTAEYLDQVPAILLEITSSRCYEFSRYIRNKVTNHYAFQDWHSGAREHKKTHRFRLYMHKQNGNTFYPFAEEASHLSLYGSRKWGDLTHNEIFEWMASANKTLATIHQQLAIIIFKHYIKDFHMKQELAYVPNRLIINEEERYPLLGVLNGSGRW